MFLFDEPLSNLDAALRAQIRVEIARLHHEIGTTMIYVTHDQVEAMTLADKIVVLDGGRVAQEGAPMDVYNHPSTAFVAGFIGAPAMNMIPTQVQAGQVFLDQLRLTVSLPDGPVTLGIRPEHLAVTSEDPGGAFPGRVQWVEALGAEAILYVQTPVAPHLLRVRVPTGLPGGSRIWLRPARQQLHVFASDGRRIGS